MLNKISELYQPRMTNEAEISPMRLQLWAESTDLWGFKGSGIAAGVSFNAKQFVSSILAAAAVNLDYDITETLAWN